MSGRWRILLENDLCLSGKRTRLEAQEEIGGDRGTAGSVRWPPLQRGLHVSCLLKRLATGRQFGITRVIRLFQARRAGKSYSRSGLATKGKPGERQRMSERGDEKPK